jgi:predicted RND superfamily exporter protein
MATPLVYLLIVWGLITAALIALLVYRSFLESREDDQIFINKAEDHIAAEQRTIIKKVTKLGAPIKILSVASGVLLVAFVGAWIWTGLSTL